MAGPPGSRRDSSSQVGGGANPRRSVFMHFRGLLSQVLASCRVLSTGCPMLSSQIVVVGALGRALIVQEVSRVKRRGNELKWKRTLADVKAIG